MIETAKVKDIKVDDNGMMTITTIKGIHDFNVNNINAASWTFRTEEYSNWEAMNTIISNMIHVNIDRIKSAKIKKLVLVFSNGRKIKIKLKKLSKYHDLSGGNTALEIDGKPCVIGMDNHIIVIRLE
jgi:hypothetical protein